MDEQSVVVGGVDTHKDLHFAAVVDGQDRVLGNECFPTTRHGYKRMLAWFHSFGELARVGVECTGSYGAGLLRYLQHAGVTVLEVTAPDKHDRRKRGKDDTIDAQNAAHAALAKVRTVTPKTRDGIVESLRVMKVCRKTVRRQLDFTPVFLIVAGQQDGDCRSPSGPAINPQYHY